MSATHTPRTLTDAQRQALREHIADTWTATNEQLNDATTRPQLDTAAERMTLHIRVCAAVIDGEITLDDPMRRLLEREQADIAAYRADQEAHLNALRAGDPDAAFVGMSPEVSTAVTVDVVERADANLAALRELLAADA